MSSSLSTVIIDRLEQLLPGQTMDELAYETKFMVRSARKVPPTAYVKAFCANAVQTISLSMSHYAVQLSLLTKTVISKQAVAEKIKSPFVAFLKKTFYGSFMPVLLRTVRFQLLFGTVFPEF